MTTAFVIIAALIVIAALIATCSDLLDQRNAARTDAHKLSDQLDAAYKRLGDVLDEHALCPVPLAPPPLYVVPDPRGGDHDDLPVADVVVPIHTEIRDGDWVEVMRAIEEQS